MDFNLEEHELRYIKDRYDQMAYLYMDKIHKNKVSQRIRSIRSAVIFPNNDYNVHVFIDRLKDMNDVYDYYNSKYVGIKVLSPRQINYIKNRHRRHVRSNKLF